MAIEEDNIDTALAIDRAGLSARSSSEAELACDLEDGKRKLSPAEVLKGVNADYERAQRDTTTQLNLVFMVQAFLFGAEAVVAQAFQTEKFFDDVKFGVRTLYFGLPLLGILLSILSCCLVIPSFEELTYLRGKEFFFSPGAATEWEKRQYKIKKAKQVRIFRIYKAILFFVFALWVAVFASSTADVMCMMDQEEGGDE